MKELIFIDESILVVNKPQGLLSVATDRLETDTMHTRCVNFVQEESEKNWAYIVHRLDKPTSGLMVFARNQMIKSIYKINLLIKTYIGPTMLSLKVSQKAIMGRLNNTYVKEKNT